MTAHTPITTLSPSWPLRWEAAKGTANETWVLMTIAAEAHKAGEYAIWRAAYDAANCPDERAEFVENLEEIFDELEEQEALFELEQTEEWAAEAMRGAGVYRGASIEARLEDARGAYLAMLDKGLRNFSREEQRDVARRGGV